MKTIRPSTAAVRMKRIGLSTSIMTIVPTNMIALESSWTVLWSSAIWMLSMSLVNRLMSSPCECLSE